MRRRSEAVDVTGKLKYFFANSDGESVDDDFGWTDGIDDVVSSYESQQRDTSEIEYDAEGLSIQAYNLTRENNRGIFEASAPISSTY